MSIGGEQRFAPDKGRAQHQQGRLRQVKIGDHGIDGAKPMAGFDEDARGASIRERCRRSSRPPQRRPPQRRPAAAVSRLLTTVVPTAITRPPAARVSLMASQVASGTARYSSCISCRSMSSTRTGWKVPAPTCNVTKAWRMPPRLECGENIRRRNAGPRWAPRPLPSCAHTRSDSVRDRRFPPCARCRAAAASRRSLRKKAPPRRRTASGTNRPAARACALARRRAASRPHPGLKPLLALRCTSAVLADSARSSRISTRPPLSLRAENPRRNHPGIVEDQEIRRIQHGRKIAELQVSTASPWRRPAATAGWRSGPLRAAAQCDPGEDRSENPCAACSRAILPRAPIAYTAQV